MADIVRGTSFRDSRGATAALMTPAARWEFSFRQTGRGHAFVRPPYSIAPANYEKFWSILPYYARFSVLAEPPGSRRAKIISRDATHFPFYPRNKYRRIYARWFSLVPLDA